jgi:hypothetical protein
MKLIMETFPNSHRPYCCAQCGNSIPVAASGRPRKFCQDCRPSVRKRRREQQQREQQQRQQRERQQREQHRDQHMEKHVAVQEGSGEKTVWRPPISHDFTVISDDDQSDDVDVVENINVEDIDVEYEKID